MHVFTGFCGSVASCGDYPDVVRRCLQGCSLAHTKCHASTSTTAPRSDTCIKTCLDIICSGSRVSSTMTADSIVNQLLQPCIHTTPHSCDFVLYGDVFQAPWLRETCHGHCWTFLAGWPVMSADALVNYIVPDPLQPTMHALDSIFIRFRALR